MTGAPRADTSDPRLGQVVEEGDWRKIKGADKYDTKPFEWGRAGIWMICWSLVDGKIKGIGRKRDGMWIFRMAAGLEFRGRTRKQIVSMFDEMQTNLRKQLH